MADATTFTTTWGTVDVLVDPAALACALADRFIEQTKSTIKRNGRCAVALAGGSTPRAAYALLAMQPRRDEVDWSKIDIFFGDERCVPPDSDQSNFRMAEETLLNQVPIDLQKVHRMRGEDDPPFAAERYSALIRRQLGTQPRFDIVMLGLGPDAHTASWFPEVVINDQLIVDAPYVPKFSAHRLTLTPHVVNMASLIIVATAGDEKADALAEVFSVERNPLRFPAQRLAPTDGELIWLVDRAAAHKAFKNFAVDVL